MACQCGGDEYGANTIPRLMMPISYCLFVSSRKHISPLHIHQQTLQNRSMTEGHVGAENNAATELKSFRPSADRRWESDSSDARRSNVRSFDCVTIADHLTVVSACCDDRDCVLCVLCVLCVRVHTWQIGQRSAGCQCCRRWHSQKNLLWPSKFAQGNR